MAGSGAALHGSSAAPALVSTPFLRAAVASRSGRVGPTARRGYSVQRGGGLSLRRGAMTYVPPGGAWAQGAAALALVPKAQAAGGDLFPEAYSRLRPCSRWSWESTPLGLGLLAKAAPPSTSALATCHVPDLQVLLQGDNSAPEAGSL
ncbi:hypothetical protein EJB05_11019, partial [Eragrostis curvula]